MFGKKSVRTIRMSLVIVLILMVTPTLVAAQSQDLFLPLVVGGEVQQSDAAGAAPLAEVLLQSAPELPTEPPAEGQEEPVISDEARAQDGDSLANESNDSVSAAAVTAFDATQWRVQERLGVGTDTPDHAVDIERHIDGRLRLQMQNLNTGSASNLQFYMHSGTNNGFLVQKFGSGYTGPGWSGIPLASWTRLRTDTEAKGLILTTGGPRALVFGTNDTPRMVIDSAGNVGIGDTDLYPVGYRLQVNGGGMTGMLVENTTFGVQIYDPVHYGLYIYRTGDDAINVASPEANGVVVNSPHVNGVVVNSPYVNGVVVNSPHANGVVVDKPADDGVVVNSPEGNGVLVTFPQHTGVFVDRGKATGMVVYEPADDGVFVYNSGADGLYVDSPGDDGVYVFHPGGDGVHVEHGNIRVTNGSFIDSGTTLNVPDYVFEPDYPLLSLDELRTYVAEEKHLPNVPDMEEIHAGGLDLSEFQMRLLEKTEELTLYLLAQDEQLKTQQHQIDTLQQENLDQDQQIAALLQQNTSLAARLTALEQQE